MKVLFLTPYLPGPPIFGGQRRIHGLMTRLADSHEVSVLALVDAAVDHKEGLRDTRSYCRQVITVPASLHRVTGRPKRLLQLGSLLSNHSWERAIYHQSAFQRALDGHLAQNEYDVVSCEFVFMASYRVREKLGRTRRTRLVLDEHNVEYDVLRRTASATSFGRRFFNAVNWRKLKREEIAAWGQFDGCTVTSRRDQELVRREAPGLRTVVVPNGVDVEVFRPDAGPGAEPKTLLFFGAMNYYPNTDAAVFFVKEIFPLITARYPGVRLRIVGPVGPGPVMDLKSDRIEVVGIVDDLRGEIDRAAMVVAPLRIGGGTRLKILEAMSMAKPIVSTSIGAEGIDVAHERDILLADTPEAFAREVGRVLDEPALRERLGQAARRLAEARYSWRAAAAELASFYEQLLETSASSPSASNRIGP